MRGQNRTRGVLACLTALLEYPRVYDRVEIPVMVSDKGLVKCIVYVMANGKEVPYNVPSLAYLDTVMRGYAINNLPPKFLYEALATAYKKSNK